MRYLALMLLALPVLGADITSTRVSSGDWQTQDANGVKIADYARQDTAIVGCINAPTCVFIVGGKYKITRATVPPVVTPPVTTPPATNRAPTLSGTPAATGTAGQAYSFVPTASDPDGQALTFSISGKPAWAAFSTTTGALTGMPSAGTYTGISVGVTDGTNAVYLPAFTITVTAPVVTVPPVTTPTNGTAALSWSAPTLNTDGTKLTDLAGYKVYHGTAANALTDVKQVASPSTAYQFTGLASGTHYFAITAYNAGGTESVLSSVGTKVIP